ncbi:MAG: hypothetical protein E7630_00175 [Ruminococcaceae bacterium]|nr:hypothetical protein [Oscillospiraceae bacterium]
MNQILGMFLGFSLLGLPLFLLILMEKCVDLRSYRKLGMTGKLSFANAPKRVLSLELLILVVSQVLNALAACLLLSNFHIITELILLYFPPLPIFSLILMYLLERKSIREASQKHSFKTKLFIINLILALAFHASYQGLLIWSFSFAEFGILGGGGDSSKQDIVLLVGSVALLVLFAFIKILIQKWLVKRTSDSSPTHDKESY